MAEIVGGQRWMQLDTTVESVAGVKNGTQTLKPFRCVGGQINMNPGVQYIDVEEHAGSTSQPAPIKSHTEPGGTVQIIPSPYDAGVDFDPGAATSSIFHAMLALGMTRTSGVLPSFSLYDAFPGLATIEYLGTKVGGFSFGFGAGGNFLDFSVDLASLHAGRLTSGLSSVGTLPSSRHWIVAQTIMQIGADLTVVTSNRKVTALQGNFSNNLTKAGKQVYYPSSRNDTVATGVQQLQEGEETLEGTIELTMEDDDWLDRFLGGTSASLRIMAFHPDSLTFTTGASVTTTSNPTVVIAEDFTTGQLVAGSYVLLQDTTSSNPDNWKTEVLRVKTETATGGAGTNSIQFETDGANDSESVGRSQTFASGTKIFTLGMQLRIPSVKVVGWSPSGAVREKQRQTVNWRAEPASNVLLGYMVR